MRSLMLVLGACLFALNFAGCSSTGSCGGSCGSQGLLGGGNMSCSGGCDTGCSGGCDSGGSCGDSACSGGCGDSGRAAAFAKKNYGGQTGLGLGLMESGPSCKTIGCKGGCKSCKLQRLQLPPRPQLLGRMKGRLASGGCGCGSASDCGCGSPTPASDCGCSTPAPTMPATSDCGCSASAPVEFSMGDSMDSSCEGDAQGSGIELASHEDRRGLLAGFSFGRKHQTGGCGVRGCGGPAGLCGSCLSRLRPGDGMGLGGRGGTGSIPHRDPSIHGGGMAGPAGQIPTYAYPYYTTRAPRDFLNPNPPTIGY